MGAKIAFQPIQSSLCCPYVQFTWMQPKSTQTGLVNAIKILSLSWHLPVQQKTGLILSFSALQQVKANPSVTLVLEWALATAFSMLHVFGSVSAIFLASSQMGATCGLAPGSYLFYKVLTTLPKTCSPETSWTQQNHKMQREGSVSADKQSGTHFSFQWWLTGITFGWVYTFKENPA